MEILGEKIKEYRTSIKMTQQDFAYRLGVTGASVSAYENGTRTPSFDVLVRIANILGVTTDDLLGRKKSHKITIDVTDLTNEQRKVIQDLIRIFSQENK
ncbi:DNA-binding protein [Pseudoflavonifractor sp. An176]|uniref:helix-turn-helix domain-containing protein n=1 Tax=Pseudoflavonifractor sp. An176 TaxID=1965572 RepID=UPI000B3ACBE5|nr:helix-turn-helix transcriptional regulator [Pseudoflavonifractor sp. An176]OUP62987.1 DNA-binding protein [Pseudoflavonifractor sp. An176]